GGRAMSNHLGWRGCWLSACYDVQFVADQFDFVFDASRIAAVLHGSGQSESIGTRCALGDSVVKLRSPDRTCNARAFLFQIEVRRPESAVRVWCSNRPVAG